VRNILVAAFLGIGIFEADDFRRCRIDCLFFFLDLVFVVYLARRRCLAGDKLLEKGARIGLAGIGRDDRILIQVIEFLAGIGVGPLRTALRAGHFLCLVE